MTTATWSSGNAHGTDAEFRAWGSEFSSKLAAVGLTQTSDTGQINWTTVTRPGANTDAGYEVWRFNDTMQSTAPIFLKFFFGTGNTTGAPRIRVEIGTGSNGSGTLTGTGSGTSFGGNATYTSIAAGSATAVPSYMCYVDGAFSYMWKRGAAGQGLFCLSRTCNASGVADGDGYLVWSIGGTGSVTAMANVRMVRFASPASVIYSVVGTTADSGVAITPGYLNTSSALPNGDKQAYMAWVGLPEMRPVVGMCAVLISEFAGGSTFTTAMVGSTVRTYLASGIAGNNAAVNNANYALAFLWE